MSLVIAVPRSTQFFSGSSFRQTRRAHRPRVLSHILTFPTTTDPGYPTGYSKCKRINHETHEAHENKGNVPSWATNSSWQQIRSFRRHFPYFFVHFVCFVVRPFTV